MSSTRCLASANRSYELTRCSLLASLETARSLPRLRIKPKTTQKNTRTRHNRDTHVQHTRVLKKTLCVRGLGFAFARGRDCVLEFVERLVVVDGRPLAPHRQTHTKTGEGGNPTTVQTASTLVTPIHHPHGASFAAPCSPIF